MLGKKVVTLLPPMGMKVALAQRMLDKREAKSYAARERTEREIRVTDEQIDRLVYELYGLTKEETSIVERE